MWEIRDCINLNKDTGELTWKYRVNNAVEVGRPIGTAHNKGYKFFRLNKTFYFNHRVVWYLAYGGWPKGEIDHINGIKDDNRLINLRDVTHRQNMLNKKSEQVSTSNYKGVHWHKNNKKWRATLWNGSSKIHLGVFNCEMSAALAYDHAAKEVFGDYARLNFPVVPGTEYYSE